MTQSTQHTALKPHLFSKISWLRLLPVILLLISKVGFSQIDPPPPNDPPCPPLSDVEEYCFENSIERFLTPCSLIVCLKVTPKPAYWEVCNIIPFFLTEEHCVVLAPGEKKCISLPVFSRPASQWFDVAFSVQTIGTSYVNELDAITYPDNIGGPFIYVTPGCENLQGHYTVISDDGFNFIFHFMLVPGFGG